MNDHSSSILQFLIELRKRLIHCLVIVALLFVVLAYFSNSLYSWLALPLLKYLPQGQGLIATQIAAPFFVPVELALVMSVFLAMPVFLYHLWAFVAPALYHHERKMLWPLMVTSSLLFYLGVAFAYFIIFPIIFKFLTNTAPHGVMVAPDISQYLDFTLKLFFIFGAMFEVPIAIILLVWTGVTTRDQLIRFRPYAIVGAFIIAMLVGPPDVTSQILVAVPLWFLYEAGIFFSRAIDFNNVF